MEKYYKLLLLCFVFLHDPVPAGVVNVLLTTPMWVVNTRLKLQGAKFRNEDLHQTQYSGIYGV